MDLTLFTLSPLFADLALAVGDALRTSASSAGGAAAGSGASSTAALALMVVGMGVVFVSLIVIALLVKAMIAVLERDKGYIEQLRATPESAAQPAAAADSASAPVQAPAVSADGSPIPPGSPGGISRHHFAVICAAVYMVNRRARVRRVVMLGQRAGDAWVAGGRMTLLGSHRQARSGHHG